MTEWEGDIREGIYVFSVPDPDKVAMSPGFIWKQDNNGTTFVICEKELPWLKEYAINE